MGFRQAEARRGFPGDTREDLGLDHERTSGADPRYGVTALQQFSIKEPAPEFPVAALPPAVSKLVREAAAAIGCPPDPIGLATLAALGSAIGNARVAKPKRDWSESAAIYAAVIADSGEKKSAAIKVAANVVRKLDRLLNRKHEAALDEFAREERDYEVDRKDAAKQGLAAPPPPKEPVSERVHVNDTTIEALIPILNDNPRGLLLERDELVGWVNAMDQYKAGGKGSDRQFWLSSWSGEQVSVDRKSQKKTLSVEKPFVSVIGSIQPGVLPELADGREDGMIERFLLAYPEPINALWTEAEITPEAEAGYRDLYDRLRDLNATQDDYGDLIPGEVTYSPEARAVFIEAYNGHRNEMAMPGFPARLRSVWSKLEAYLVRITLILAACRFADRSQPERIEAEDVVRALTLMDYFKAQARRIFGALHDIDPRLRLLEDCSRFVAERGGTWSGTATGLHAELVSKYKPGRPEELSKFIKETSDKVAGISYETETERYKDDSGTWKSRRVSTLTIENRRNAVTL